MTLFGLILLALMFGAVSQIFKHLLGWETPSGFKGLCVELCFVVTLGLSVLFWTEVVRETGNYEVVKVVDVEESN